MTERVFWNTRAPLGKERRAALAIRDNVSPFQKWGSKQFTLPYLERYYDAAWYFTQTHRGDCKDTFISTLNTALQRYPEVDLFLLAHSNQYIDWVAELPSEHAAISVWYTTLVAGTCGKGLPGWIWGQKLTWVTRTSALRRFFISFSFAGGLGGRHFTMRWRSQII